MKRTIDLHTHSYISLDGEKRPEELIDLAIRTGIAYYAIADHDDVRAIPIALEYAKDKDIDVIPATEVSSIVDEYPLHVLGYGFDYTHPVFKERRDYVDKELIGFREKAIEKARNFGFQFDESLLLKYREDHLVCEEMIGEVILNDPRNDDNPALLEFREGGRLSDNPIFNFFKEFYTLGKPCFVPYDFNMDIINTSKMIHEANGKVFLAHPGHNIKRNEEVLKKIVDAGLDGIEVFSSYHDKETTDFYYEMAKKYNLCMSVGSDYHGHSKPSIQMASIDYDEEELKKTLKMIGAKI